MLTAQAFELTDDRGVLPERKLCVDPGLERLQPLFVEPFDIRPRPRLGAQVTEHGTAPER